MADYSISKDPTSTHLTHSKNSTNKVTVSKNPGDTKAYLTKIGGTIVSIGKGDTSGSYGPGVATPTFYATLLSSLTLTNGTAASTFIRNTLATVLDWEGLVKTTVANEPRFQGARRVENILNATSSEDISIGTWIKTGSTALDSDTLRADGAGKFVRNEIETGKPILGRTFTFSAVMWIDSGENPDMQLTIKDGGYQDGNKDTFTITTTPTRYSVTALFDTSARTDLILIPSWDNSVNLDEFHVTDFLIEEVTGQSNQNPSEYVSIGVESSPYHGANVDGVQYFEYQNGNTVASNVVTEATGAALTTLDGYLNEELRTNQADTTDDLTGGADTVDLTAVGTGDYTLSVSSDAAVTVAAGTATGTGFGQAVAGTPVTFNLSVAGTVTLTLDSGTLTLNANGEYEYNLEKGSFATSWIPTAGTPSTRHADVLTYDYQPPALLGSMLCTTISSGSDGSGDEIISSNGLCRYLFITTYNRSYDGGSQANYDVTGNVGVSAKFGLTWEDSGSPERALYKDASQAATSSLDANGYLTSGNPLGIYCRGSAGTTQANGTIKNVKIFDIAQDQTFMETAANYE